MASASKSSALNPQISDEQEEEEEEEEEPLEPLQFLNPRPFSSHSTNHPDILAPLQQSTSTKEQIDETSVLSMASQPFSGTGNQRKPASFFMSRYRYEFTEFEDPSPHPAGHQDFIIGRVGRYVMA